MSVNSQKNSPLIQRLDRIICPECGTDAETGDAPMFQVMACPNCNVELRVPGLFGSIFLLKIIGEGSSGTVYKAFDQNMHEQVAVKIMHQHLGEDRRHVDHFLGEAQTLRGLNHPNVVRMHSFGRVEKQPYIVMELIQGSRMEDLIDSKKGIKEVQLLEIAIDVTKGLQAADSMGVQHGDIKVENILIDHQGTSKVVDFGLARAFRDDDDEVFGTPYFIAPERARKDPEDHRADIYSLGATLFDVLAGQPPFVGDSVVDVVEARLKGPAPHLTKIKKSVSKPTANMIACMLEMDPNDRHPDYKAVLADLYGALSEALKKPKINTPKI